MASQVLHKKRLPSLFRFILITTLFYCDVPQAVFAQNTESEVNETIKLRLNVSGPDNEWIRIEFNDNKTGQTVLSAYHTKRVKRSFESGLANGLLGFGAEELVSEATDGDYDGPVPLPSVNFLPNRTDIQRGRLTIEYAEEDLIRSITFRLPSDKDK